MPLSQVELKKLFGSFTYRENTKKRGTIIIEPAWVRAHIESVETPFGRFRCHKRVSYQMRRFINAACSENLVTDIGGIWVSRHILWDPGRPLSGHAYGCDIDINVDDGRDGPGGRLNYGDNSYQPPALRKIAERWGFEWGGDWRRNKDGMHFSCVRIIAEGNVEASPGRPPELRMGERGDDVKDLQRRLNAHGYRLHDDGIFGPKTAGALVDWQKSNGFKASGRTDPQTWHSLGRR
jgi:hypothetical protein